VWRYRESGTAAELVHGLSPVELGDEGLDPPTDLIARGAHLVERPAGGVGEVPVDVALARDVWALIAAAHGDDDVGLLGELAGQESRAAACEVDSEFAHRIEDLWMDASGRSRPCGRRGVPPAGGPLEQRLAHLGAAGVVEANEQHVSHLSRSYRLTTVSSIDIYECNVAVDLELMPKQKRPAGVRCCEPLVYPDVGAERAERIAAIAKALGDPVRLQLVDVLRKHAGKVCVCELVPLFDLSQPTVSHHLKVLREAGIVGAERQGLWAYYFVIPEALEELTAWLS
jgi:ArsR family transcriptional regulator, arsenate/arsenite/antimonite-responsive transcriptional repressor